MVVKMDFPSMLHAENTQVGIQLWKFRAQHRLWWTIMWVRLSQLLTQAKLKLQSIFERNLAMLAEKENGKTERVYWQKEIRWLLIGQVSQ